MRRLTLGIALALGSGLESQPADAAPATIRLRVQVKDALGKPVAKARGALFKATPQSGRAARLESPIAIAKQGAALVAGPDGLIETPPLAVKQAYVLEIDADGFAPELSRWTHPTQSGTIELPPVRLRRLCAIKGRVVDRQGRPLANVTVIQSGDGPKRLESVTDREGRFVLDGVPEGNVAVCFEAVGFRFIGAVLSAPALSVRIELERPGDPHPRLLKRLPIPPNEWPDARRTAAATKLLEPLMARAMKKDVVDESDLSTMLAAARSDPERMLARVDKLKFDRPFRQAMVRNSAILSLLAREKPEAALQAASKLADPATKLNAYLYWFPNNHRSRADLAARRAALKKARDLIAASKETRSNAFSLCELAAQLWDAGQRDASREVVNECRAVLNKMPPDAPGWQALRLNLAAAVARDNVAEAKKLAAELEPGPMLRLAGEVARHHPQEVEAFLADVPNELSLMQLRGVANNLPQVVCRVARHDAAEAERLLVKYARPPKAQSDAESIFGLGGSLLGNFSKELIDFQVLKVKAVCYGLIAEEAARNDLPAARHALLQAVELIRPLRSGFIHPASQFYHTPAGLMVLLVPVAERIDPALASEIFWRALSLRISMPGESFDRMMLDIDTPDLVSVVKFYDKPLAAGLLEPVLTRLVARSYSGMPTYVWALQSLTLMDPQRAVEFPSSLGALPGWDGSLPGETASQFIGSVLTNASLWEKDLDHRLANQLAHVRSVYGAYVDTDETEP